ncbi:hypothetical protein DT076_07240 [Desertihabitans brevis]|uniref:Nucleotidyltransferase domain-containing protein n=1 Tax=Desertihabitans brevis TaxID=2268447 RepID=A0A367YX79_9ACTN|nr:hypothetical protein [Desertihabitans brevis]RCK70430.1 hypothetical protein DT076_07240 [Desertihabitans brevis]
MAPPPPSREHGLEQLPAAARPVVEAVAERWRQYDDLAWAYGQGSVLSGFRDDSDIDLVAVWEEMPAASTLPFPSIVSGHRPLVFERGHAAGFELDVQHVPRQVFAGWMDELTRGGGWSEEQWPMPVHVAAGLAQGVLLVDRAGDGEAVQRRAQEPGPRLVSVVLEQLDARAPDFLTELEKADAAGNRWLHDSLAVELHRLVYVAWFLAEGHHPPFFKHLPDWFERLSMDTDVRHLEASYWAVGDARTRRATLAELVSAVLELGGRG